MRGPLLLFAFSATGMLAGGWLGHNQSSPVWPELSRLNLVWMCAAGWLLGATAGMAIAWLTRQDPEVSEEPKAGWRRVAGGLAVLAALSPVALWLTLASPGGFLHEAAPLARVLGERRPNIILVSIDALRPDFLGAYGSEAGLTPNLDAFAAEATVYDAAYAPAPWTLASFASLFSGRAPSLSISMRKVGEHPTDYVDRVRLFKQVPLLPERLGNVGYRTAAELTNPFLTEHFGWGRGFEYFRNEDGADAGLLLTSDTTRADTITQHAHTWLRLNHYEPFLLWVHYLDPHAPYDAPDALDEMSDTYPEEWETSRSYWAENIAGESPEVKALYESFCRERYGAEVKYVDRWVGRLLDRVKQEGFYEDSFIVIFADHGEELLDHGAFDHGHSLHEEVLRVPLIVKWPSQVSSDSLVHRTVALTDLYLTALKLAGEPLPAEVADGALPRTDGGAGGEVYSEGLLHAGRQTALTTDEWKVIYTPGGNAAEDIFEVYHRPTDRLERHDLAREGAAPELQDRLRAVTREMGERQAVLSSSRLPSSELDEETRRQLHSLGYLSD